MLEAFREWMLKKPPDVTGYFRLVSIILWGLAYILVCETYKQSL